METSNHARMLAVAPGGWDRCLCRSCRLPESDRRLRRSARRIESRRLRDEIASHLSDPADHPEDIDRLTHLDWLSDDIMATNPVFAAWDHAARAEAAAAERAHRIAAFEAQAEWDPNLNDRCHDRDVPGWRGGSRYGVCV